ncbi:MAG: GAF domain-containing protein [Deltaproteobacteria bacterium]|nr:GAF domain-containing protein [Deltaproteobacteria bacterium]
MHAFDEDAYLEAAKAGDFRKVLEPQRQLLNRLLDNPELEAGDPSQSLAELTETVARLLRVGRASLWRFEENRERLFCLDLYVVRDQRHVAGSAIQMSEAPSYFEAIRQGEILAVNDAYTDPRTREFAKGYLAAFNIGAVLDAPLHVRRRLVGALCCEHIGGIRRWQPWERILANSLAECAGIVLHQVVGQLRRPTLRDIRLG